MAMNKRGVFFTLMTIIILSLFVFSTIFYSDYLSRESVQKRAETLDNFIFSTEKDLERQLYINGFRAIYLLEKRITETGSFQTDTQEVFQEAFFNGTLYGTPELLLTTVKYGDSEREIKERAKQINANVTITNHSLTVYQVDPWNVRYTLQVNLFLEDFGGLVNWNKTMTVSSDIGIETFSDPLYLNGTSNREVNKFVQSPFSNFVVGGDFSNLANHTRNSYYVASSDAPSFLMRLEGDLSASDYGIESLVFVQGLEDSPKQKSIVDHVYFSNNNPSYCTVSVPGIIHFRIDNSTDHHLDLYNLSSYC